MNNKLTEKPAQSKEKSESFLKIPTSFLDDDRIKPTAFIVYAALVAFRNARSGACFPGVPTIAKRAGVSDDTVRIALNQLESAGWIKRLKNKGKPNDYLFPIPSTGTPQRIALGNPSPQKIGTPSPAATGAETDEEYLTRKQQEFPQHKNVKKIYADFLSKCGSEKYPKMKPTRRKFDKWIATQDEEMESGNSGEYVNPLTGKGLK
jgi:DNA-binding transcriptional MocR family regulator